MTKNRITYCFDYNGSGATYQFSSAQKSTKLTSASTTIDISVDNGSKRNFIEILFCQT